jgi:hypothetical protein
MVMEHISVPINRLLDDIQERRHQQRPDRSELARVMGIMLVTNEVDLGDERAVADFLVPYFGPKNVNEFIDQAIDVARTATAQRMAAE